ncbi:lipoyl protein ligase domain-containing protein [Candidatus Palauibacter sp.]|uniref:lipoyl protein ligase domain-containing protein n=1 Tax=Candidatus Palauibacter sp. TaxID=3101350 RepID=UPI003B51B7DA
MTGRRTRPRPAGSPCVVLPYGVADGARNMAMDEAMLELAAGGATLLRFYGWEPWCLSLGRHQEPPDRLLGRSPEDLRPGVDAVRRPTGGRSVFHGPEITYAFACPARAWGRPRVVLQTVHRALGEGLRSLGVPLDEAMEGDPPDSGSLEVSRISGESCFRDPAPGELTVRGRKLVGSAQCCRHGGVLQHGSILLEDRQTLGDLDRKARPDEGSAAAVADEGPAIGLTDLLDPVPDTRLIVERLADTVARAFGARTAAASYAATPALTDLATGYESVHRSGAWLWLRERPSRHA